jgi:hypothetical protein
MSTIITSIRIGVTFLFASVLLFTSCKKETETVFITPTISVDLPANYNSFLSHSTSSVITNPDVKKEHKNYNYRADINNDEIFITNLITDEFDSLNVNERIVRIKKGGLKGIVRGFNGRNLIHEEQIINGLAQSEFSFESEMVDTLYFIYGRLIIQDSNFVVLGYRTMMPVSNISIKEKDEFFKSLQFK